MMRSRRNPTTAALLCMTIALLAMPVVSAQDSTKDLEDALSKAGAKSEAREVVEIVMFVRLAQELELSEDETVLLVRRMSEFRKEMARMHKKQRELRKDLREAYGAKAGEEELLAKLTKLREHDRRLNNLKLDLHAELSEGYDARTQARLYLFLQEFDESMRRMVQNVRERARGMQGGRGGRGPEGVGRGPMRGNPPRDGLGRGGRGGRPPGPPRGEHEPPRDRDEVKPPRSESDAEQP